jgi:hypothetical protein
MMMIRNGIASRTSRCKHDHTHTSLSEKLLRARHERGPPLNAAGLPPIRQRTIYAKSGLLGNTKVPPPPESHAGNMAWQ